MKRHRGQGFPYYLTVLAVLAGSLLVEDLYEATDLLACSITGCTDLGGDQCGVTCTALSQVPRGCTVTSRSCDLGQDCRHECGFSQCEYRCYESVNYTCPDGTDGTRISTRYQFCTCRGGRPCK